MGTYILRDTPAELWRQFKSRAALEGRPLRAVLLALIKLYIDKGLPPYPDDEDAMAERAEQAIEDGQARWSETGSTRKP